MSNPNPIDSYKCDNCNTDYICPSEGYLFSMENKCNPWAGLRKLCKKCYEIEFPEGHEKEIGL